MSEPARPRTGLVARLDEPVTRRPLPTIRLRVGATDFHVRSLDALRACGLRYRDGGRWRLSS